MLYAVKSLKAYQHCLYKEHNGSERGINALHAKIQEALDTLMALLGAYANELIAIQQNTQHKKNLLELLAAAKRECESQKGITSDMVLIWKLWLENDEAKDERAAKKKEAERSRPSREKKRVPDLNGREYDAPWYRLSSVDSYFLERYGNGKCRLEDLGPSLLVTENFLGEHVF